jgi:hypothetical protein
LQQEKALADEKRKLREEQKETAALKASVQDQEAAARLRTAESELLQAALARDGAALVVSERNLKARDATLKAREAEADAVLAIAEGLATGTLELDETGAEINLTDGPTASPPIVTAIRTRIAASPKGRSKAMRAFGAA